MGKCTAKAICAPRQLCVEKQCVPPETETSEKVELQEKPSSSSLRSPHDPDVTYGHKGKGYEAERSPQAQLTDLDRIGISYFMVCYQILRQLAYTSNVPIPPPERSWRSQVVFTCDFHRIWLFSLVTVFATSLLTCTCGGRNPRNLDG